MKRALAAVIGQEVEVEGTEANPASGLVVARVAFSATGGDYGGVRLWAERQHDAIKSLAGLRAGCYYIVSARQEGFVISYIGNGVWGARVRLSLTVREEP